MKKFIIGRIAHIKSNHAKNIQEAFVIFHKDYYPLPNGNPNKELSVYRRAAQFRTDLHDSHLIPNVGVSDAVINNVLIDLEQNGLCEGNISFSKAGSFFTTNENSTAVTTGIIRDTTIIDSTGKEKVINGTPEKPIKVKAGVQVQSFADSNYVNGFLTLRRSADIQNTYITAQVNAEYKHIMFDPALHSTPSNNTTTADEDAKLAEQFDVEVG